MNTQNHNGVLTIAASAIMQHLDMVEEQNPKPKVRITEAQRKKRQFGQAKDIPDGMMLLLIKTLISVPKVYPGYDRYDNNTKYTYYWNNHTVMWGEICKVWDYIPPKVIQAKLNGMINRGLVDGCACGCSGQFRVDRKGEAVLALYEARIKKS